MRTRGLGSRPFISHLSRESAPSIAPSIAVIHKSFCQLSFVHWFPGLSQGCSKTLPSGQSLLYELEEG